ncbi:DUF2948 family protein [Nitrospirillum iridis]|uniref:DUF2948 family protein n=1 Tax=Nitrospirillum iridis TaxID=765888 RepID=A0A7X0EET6_9PROT|nr:DUF2948 family protein [Nitrospirillum iridis]MBB6252391.1 hypothetical protein [Nitrospirillum iridis]
MVLRLAAEDAVDLTVVSGLVQDALLPLSDITWYPRDGVFLMVLNRFCWEKAARVPLAGDEAAGEGDGLERVHSALGVSGVRRVRYRGLDPHDRTRPLSLLALEAVPGGILLRFAAGGAILLDGQDMRLKLEDVSEPWPALVEPTHH